MLLTAGLATTFGSSAAGLPAPPPAWLAVFAVLVIGISAMRGMYGWRLRYEVLEDLRVVVIATSVSAMALLSIRELISASPDLAAQGVELGDSLGRPEGASVRLALVVVHRARARARELEHRACIAVGKRERTCLEPGAVRAAVRRAAEVRHRVPVVGPQARGVDVVRLETK